MRLETAYGIAAVLGGIVGAIEIFQRYRAEPFHALGNVWGLGYVVFNAAVALAAMFVLVRSEALSGKTSELDLLRWSAAAGFGSAAMLRTKLLNIRNGDGKEFALGPELVVQTFLSVIDREIDRLRARSRFATVWKLFEGVDFEKAKVSLPIHVFQAMQRVTEEDTQKLMKRVGEVDALKTLPPRDKAFQLGFYLLDLVGEEFLTDVMTRHGAEFRVKPAA